MSNFEDDLAIIETVPIPKHKQKRKRHGDDVEIVAVITKPKQNDIEFVEERRINRMPVWYTAHSNVLYRSPITMEIMENVTKNPIPRSRMMSIPVQTTPEPTIEPAMLKCTVCLELASDKTQLCATNCGHIFCEECLMSALKVSKKCPNCRKSVSKKGYHKLFL